MFKAFKAKKTFNYIYDTHIDKIFRFILFKVESQETAQDLCSEVFTRTWKSIKQGTDIENPSAFLYKVAKNLIANHYREKGRTRTLALDDCKEIQDPNTDIGQDAVLMSDINTVRHAMVNLKQDYQDVIMWRYIDDLSISEISKILKKPEGTVRVTLHRGLKALRHELS